MKKLTFTVIILSITMSHIFAQQVPLFSQYHYNEFLYNPALTGAYKRPQLYLVHRVQWDAIGGGPTQSAITYETSLNKDKIGLGGIVYNDYIGDITKFVGLGATYKYNLRLSETTTLALGLGAGINRLNMDFTKAFLKDGYDPTLFGLQNENRMTFQGTGGLNFNWRDLNVGLAVPNLFNTKAKFFRQDSLYSASTYYQFQRHLIANLSYKFMLSQSKDISLTPLILMKYGKGVPPQFDINAIANFQEKYWGGVAYRTAYGITLSAGAKLFDQLTIGFAYDIHTNKAWAGKNLVGQTYEIILGYQFGREKNNLEERVNKLDNDFMDYDKKINAVDSNVKDTNKKMDKMNNDLKKRDDDNFENLKKQIDKLNGDADAIKQGGTMKEGSVYTLSRIYFKTDRSDLLPGSMVELDELVETMNRLPNMNIEITGHADATNTDAYNQKLSERRAKQVYDYLISKGISKDRLTFKGEGEKKPIADNSIEAGRQLNRRVEFKITKF